MGSSCSEHPDRAARAVCTGCERKLCGACLEMALESSAQHCTHCHAVAALLPAPVAAAAVARAPLPVASVMVAGGTSASASEDDSPVTKVTRYLLAKETLWTLAALTLFTTLLRELGSGSFYGGRLRLVAFGLETAYYFRVLTSIAYRDPHFETPDFSSLHEDVIDPLIRYLATLVPLVIAVFWLGERATGHWLDGLVVLGEPHSILDAGGPGLLFVAWLALWPLMTIIAAIGRSVIACYNPVVWVRTLAMLRVRYAIGVALFYTLLIAETYVLPELAVLRSIPVAGVFVIYLVANLAMALRGCVLGIVCEPFT